MSSQSRQRVGKEHRTPLLPSHRSKNTRARLRRVLLNPFVWDDPRCSEDSAILYLSLHRAGTASFSHAALRHSAPPLRTTSIDTSFASFSPFISPPLHRFTRLKHFGWPTSRSLLYPSHSLHSPPPPLLPYLRRRRTTLHHASPILHPRPPRPRRRFGR